MKKIQQKMWAVVFNKKSIVRVFYTRELASDFITEAYIHYLHNPYSTWNPLLEWSIKIVKVTTI